MLWDLSVHNTELSFDSVRRLDESRSRTCLHFPVSIKRNQRMPMVIFSAFLFLLQRFILTMFLISTTSDTDCTPIPANSMSQICSFLCCFPHGFFRFVPTAGISGSRDSSSSSFPISTSARDSPNWFDVITHGYCISIQSCSWTYRRGQNDYQNNSKTNLIWNFY